MKIFLIILTLLFHKNIDSKNKLENDDKKINVFVNGLVCDFCARSIEKIFKKDESVSNIEVNLEKMLITIYVNQNKILNDKTIKKLINDSGYDVTEIYRDQ